VGAEGGGKGKWALDEQEDVKRYYTFTYNTFDLNPVFFILMCLKKKQT
jgi:hypothetical protein